MGQLDNTIVVFTTDNGAETITFPDGGITPFKGRSSRPGKAACARRWSSAGRAHIKPGTVKNEHLRVARLGADARRHRRRPEGRRAEEARSRPASIPASSRPRSTASTSATTSKASREKSARDTSSTTPGATPSAVRYKNWKMYFTMCQPGPAGWITGVHALSTGPRSQNIKRDPVRAGRSAIRSEDR